MQKDRRRGRPERRVSVLSDHLCECGCGRRTYVIPKSDLAKGWVKGEPRRFVHGHASVRRPPKRWGPRGIKVVRWVVEDRGFESACWIWQLALDKHGYGKLTRRGVQLKAHRVAWEAVNGSIAAGLEIHHRCEVKECVNPAHMQPLTPEEHGQLHGEVWRRAA